MKGASDNRFFRGRFHSQFHVPKLDQQGNHKSGEIELLPRYIVSDLQYISEAEYNDIISNRVSDDALKFNDRIFNDEPATNFHLHPHIYRKGKFTLEERVDSGEARVFEVDEFLINCPSTIAGTQYTGFNFLAQKDSEYHGRIDGEVFFRVVEDLSKTKNRKNGQITGITTTRSGDLADLESNRGCFGRARTQYAKLRSFLYGAPLSGSRGCLSTPGGGCGSNGCGCLLPLLLLLLILGLLSKCFNSNTSQPQVKEIVVHDTVYIKEEKQVKELVDSVVVNKTDAILLPNVQFYTNSARLLPYSIRSIQELAEYLNKHPEITAIIKGHTDDVGNPEANLKLSQERAETVRGVLISLGVSPERITAKGYGSTMPKTTDKTVEARALNRRVEVELLNTESVQNSTQSST